MSSYAGHPSLDAPLARVATAHAANEATRPAWIEEVREFEYAWGMAYIRRDTAALPRKIKQLLTRR